MKKIVSALLVVMLVFSMLPVFASAAEVTATLSFASTAQRVSQDSSSQVWANEGITFTNNKAASSTAVANYSNPVRLYASSDVIIEYPGMTKIEIAVNASKYVSPLTGSTFSSGTVTSSGNTVTIVFSAPTDSLTITKLKGQTRFNSLTVTAEVSSGDTTCEHTNVVENSDGTAATCTETGLTNSFSCADCGETVTYQQVIAALGHNVVDGVCTRCGEEQVLYDLVTDVAELTTGSQVVIVATGYGMALSTIQANNNRQQTAIEKTGTQVALNENVQVLTIGTGTVANTYSFYTGEGYLYAADSTGSQNYLRTKATLDATGSFTVEIAADGVATVKAQGGVARNWLRYNQTSSIFSCYASGQMDIAIYKLAGTGSEPVECDHPTSTVQNDAVAPDCTTVGYTATEKCDTCGAVTKYAEEIPALGHTFVDYACSVCMAIDPESPLTATRMSELPANGDKILVYHYNSKVIMSSTFNSYGERLVGVSSAAANGVLPYGASAAVLTVIVTEDGEYAFLFADGKYLASAEAGNALVLADELDDLSLWTVTALEAGSFNIVNNGATYNGTDYNQALECYSGNFTTYGLQSTAAFQIDLYLVEAAPCTHTNTTEQADGKAATCTETGLTNSWTCDACGETVIAQEVIPVIDHAWDEGVYTDPTTEADGYTTFTCTVCGATEVEVDEGSKLPPVVLDPAIIAQPQNVTAESGTDAQFYVEVQGEVVSYKWEYRQIWKWFNTTMTGYNTNTLTVPAKASRNGYDYRCVITFADGTVLTTEPAELTVNSYITEIGNPNDQTVVLGYKGQFTATATGEGLDYRWYYMRPDGTKWLETAMEGYNKPTVYIESTAARDGYKYRCQITDDAGVVAYTEPATMRVLSFKSHPVETFAANGTTATFTVTTSVADGFTYEWMYSKDNGATWTATTMAGYNTATLSVDAINDRNGYMYKCVLTGSKNSKIDSKPAVLHVGDPVVVNAQPQNVTATAADTAVFTVDATNVYAYQWEYSKTNGEIWALTTAEGNQTATLSIAAKGKNGYLYRCHIYGLDGTDFYTDVVTLTVG